MRTSSVPLSSWMMTPTGEEVEQRFEALDTVAQGCRQLGYTRLVGRALGHVDEGDDHAADHVVDRAVRHHPHDVARVVVVALDLALERGQRAQHALGVLLHRIEMEAGADMGDRPAGVALDQAEYVLGGRRELFTARLRSRNTVAICVLSSRLAMSLLARDSSSTRAFSSALTVCSSSLIDCNSSFEVSSSSLADCSSSFIEESSSLPDFSSSLEDSSSSVVVCSRSLVARSSISSWRRLAFSGSSAISGVSRLGRPLDAADILEDHHEQRLGAGRRPYGMDDQVDRLAAAIGTSTTLRWTAALPLVSALYIAARRSGRSPWRAIENTSMRGTPGDSSRCLPARQSRAAGHPRR